MTASYVHFYFPSNPGAVAALFAPDLEQPLPQALPLPEVLPWQARQARVGDALEQFEQALSAWPEEGTPVNTVALAESVRRLLDSVEHIATRRMLWVASSVADALRDGALPAVPAPCGAVFPAPPLPPPAGATPPAATVALVPAALVPAEDPPPPP